MLECPYCRLLLGSEAATVCPRCGTPHHLACFDELGGCASEGCPAMIRTQDSNAPVAWWGSTRKKCPYCAEEIPVSDTKCSKCGAEFAGIRPVEVEEVLPPVVNPAVKGCRRTAKWLFFFSILTPTSPLALIFGALWYREHRADIERAGRDVRALALISFGICGLYLTMAVFGSIVYAWSGAGGR